MNALRANLRHQRHMAELIAPALARIHGVIATFITPSRWLANSS